MEICSASVQGAWLYLLDKLLHEPEYAISPRGLATREILGVTLQVNDLRNNIVHHPVRNLNYKFMVAEWLWVTFGRADLATLAQYNGQMARFSDDGETLAGAYGPRLAPQWDYVVGTLRKDPASRQAIAVIWKSNPVPSLDIPCTVSLQFLLRENRLHLIVTMRSSDVWLGVPYDAFTFSQLASCLAGDLGVDTGSLTMQLGSSHLYASNVEQVKNLLASSRVEGMGSPRLPGWPDPGLEAVLARPDLGHPVLPKPWERYAQILKAETWREARNILYGMT